MVAPARPGKLATFYLVSMLCLCASQLATHFTGAMLDFTAPLHEAFPGAPHAEAPEGADLCDPHGHGLVPGLLPAGRPAALTLASAEADLLSSRCALSPRVPPPKAGRRA